MRQDGPTRRLRPLTLSRSVGAGDVWSKTAFPCHALPSAMLGCQGARPTACETRCIRGIDMSVGIEL
jgi:hypothetical protein